MYSAVIKEVACMKSVKLAIVVGTRHVSQSKAAFGGVAVYSLKHDPAHMYMRHTGARKHSYQSHMLGQMNC